MTGDVTIRAATMDDYSAICQLFHELDDHHVRIRPDVFQHFNGPPRRRDVITRLVDDRQGEIFLAEVGKEIVALATVHVKDCPDAPMFRPCKIAVMDNLVVSQDYRGAGVGKKLLDRVAKWAESRNIPSINISVWIENESGMSFFAANGFKPMCQRMELRLDSEGLTGE